MIKLQTFVGVNFTFAIFNEISSPIQSRNVASLEKSIVSIERIKEYQNTPVEAPFDILENDPPPTW